MLVGSDAGADTLGPPAIPRAAEIGVEKLVCID